MDRRLVKLSSLRVGDGMHGENLGLLRNNARYFKFLKRIECTLKEVLDGFLSDD